MASVKINITLPPELLDRMDVYAKCNSVSRSGLIALSVSQYLNAVEAMPQVNKILASLAAVADGTLRGELTKEEADLRMKSIQAAYEDISDKNEHGKM